MKLHGIRSAEVPPVKKILLVDDDANILASFRRRLGQHFDISTALGGEEGLEVLRSRGPFAVIISDQRMPGMDGIQFLSEVKKRAPDTVLMMFTGHTDLETATSAINEGRIFRFYTKPCPTEVLKGAIEAGLDQYELVTAERDFLERTLAGSVKVFVDVLALISPEIFRKAERVRGWMPEVARSMDISNAWELNIAAMLAPLGMVTIPTKITAKLDNGGALSQVEEEIYNRAPEISKNLISNIPRMENIGRIIYYQRKGFDGSGIPADGTSGDDLPLGARILRVLNDLAAITEHPKRVVFDALEKKNGLYDPEILRVVRSCFVDDRDGSGVSDEHGDVNMLCSDLQAGSLLASDIETLDGITVLAAGARLTLAQIERLHNLQLLCGLREPVTILEPARESDSQDRTSA